MCGCQRTTYLCLCRHKERRIERCHIYQLREAGSCWAYCFPKCQAKVRRYCLQRVCRDCEAYFREKYGEEQYKKLIQLFLEYKESKGWGKQAIDPRTIPREVLLKRQSAPPKLPSHNDGQTRARGQPYQPHQPMAMAPANRHQNDRGLAPVAEHSYGQPKIRRHGTPFCREPPSSSNSEAGTVTSVKSVISSIKATFVPKVSGARHTQRPEPLYIPSNTNKPYPADPSLFVVGDSDEEDDNTEHVDKGHEFFVEPKCLYDSRKLPRVHGIIPELAHLARVKRSGKPGTKTPETPKVYTRETPELQHPRPKHYKVPTEYRNPESISDCSLVKRITKAARKLVIPNLDWEEMENGKLVPYIMTPLPGEPRTPTPPSSAASVENTGETKRYTFSEMRPIDVAIANNTVPEFLVPGRGRPQAGERRDEKFAITPISYFVTTSPDPKSPTGASVRLRRARIIPTKGKAIPRLTARPVAARSSKKGDYRLTSILTKSAAQPPLRRNTTLPSSSPSARQHAGTVALSNRVLVTSSRSWGSVHRVENERVFQSN
ncbi:hypothetical protein NPX13_g5616 [Xylaria arbuscula]|uniref:Uncharacterized protein n=1 Tax=Xylaria arbuscula TaxID=114810 RepID=A0A9W8NE12_9PEZI|nr:hypothetical protein NPX13_g5616 [Xylaria arbuscula]